MYIYLSVTKNDDKKIHSILCNLVKTVRDTLWDQNKTARQESA